MMWGVGGGEGVWVNKSVRGERRVRQDRRLGETGGWGRQGVMGDRDKPNRGGKKGERVDKE